MPVVLEAVSKSDYEQWVRTRKNEMASERREAERLWTLEELMTRGEDVYAAQCASCHQANGEGLAPAFPALAGSNVATGPLEAHIDIILNGVEGTAMQAWGEMLTETDIAAALTYTRNAFGNDTGDLVQPRTINRIKSG
jgi:cytochrome c oxidase subunit 2